MGERQLISTTGTDTAEIDLGNYPSTIVEIHVSTSAGPITFNVYNSINGDDWLLSQEIIADTDASVGYWNAFRYLKVEAVGGTGNSITIAGAN